MRLFRTITALCAVSLGGAALAQDDAASHWRALTQMDVKAAYGMLQADHPGAAEELGDKAFREGLASGYAKAKARAGEVTSYDGYVATLAALSMSAGDKHVWSRPLYVSELVNWPGLIIARRGGDFVVADEDKASEGASLKGAKLVSCDGVTANRMADERLGEFRVVRGIEAQLIQRAYWMLLDDGNPFLKQPQTCEFAQDGAMRTLPLKWRLIGRSDFRTRLSAAASRGAAGFGLRKAGEGYWIAVESFGDAALPVVEEVRKQSAALRDAPFVVLDLRGNSGGNSLLGDDIARELLGPKKAEAVYGGGESGEGCSKVWRVSDRNMKQLLFYKTDLGPRYGKEAAEAFAKEYDTAAAAKAAGQSFSGKVRCGSAAGVLKVSAKKKPQEPKFGGRVLLLTDNSCFSSCLMVAERFRELGALHVGETTDANTHYMEVREDKLPSGLSMFSTLQAVSPSRPRQLGPFTPSIVYTGNIADTAELEKWVVGVAGS